MTARILVTGGSGFIGRQVVQRLASESAVERVVSVDVRESATPAEARFVSMDVRDSGLLDIANEEGINRIVHLAAIVTPRQDHTREFLHSVDVDGTSNVVSVALASSATHLTVTSSGAAYGYHPDNPDWIDEQDEIRGNREFAYSDHKRLVEEELARIRSEHPELGQLILRPGTILGETVENQITALFEKPLVLGIAGAPTPFVFIWDSDVVDIIVRGTVEQSTGVYNLAGTGAVTMRQIARELGKPYLPIPAPVVRTALSILQRMGWSRYGPEQVDFLRYRPVLSNRRLVEEFGFEPTMTSLEALRAWHATHE